jgi:hypothetical protein
MGSPGWVGACKAVRSCFERREGFGRGSAVNERPGCTTSWIDGHHDNVCGSNRRKVKGFPGFRGIGVFLAFFPGSLRWRTNSGRNRTMRRSLAAATLALLASFAISGMAVASGPERFETTFTYTLTDALADYEKFGDNAGDCGAFVLLVDYTVERQVAVWPDREVRYVHYTGHYYSSADTSRSIERSGDFTLTFWLDSTGAPTGVTRTGVFEYIVIDGRRITTNVGRDELSFATGPISATPKAGAQLTEEACDALA